jgi:alpha-tubulin suppressor-like RCC1 family protein
MVSLSGCSLLVPGNDGLTPDLVDGGQVDRDGGRDADVEPGTDAGAACEAGLTECGDGCVDTQSDLAHCGGCDSACAATDVCREGECFDPVVEVAAGTNHTCAVQASGAVWCWGKNETGQLGTGDFADSSVPRRVVDIDDAIGVTAAGRIFGGFPGVTCVHRSSGQAWCWGFNDSSQLGDATSDVRNRPVRAGSLEGVLRTETGLSGSCALRTADPNLLCWGGLRTDGTPRTVPEGILGLPLPPTRVVDLDMSNGHVCAVDDDEQLWCWGINDSGQLGDGTTTSRAAVARVVPDLTDVVEVATGLVSTCARQSSGQVWCWGMAQMLGVGMTGTDPVTSPQRVTSVSNAIRLHADQTTMCAIRVDGSVWCWGRDILESERTGTEVMLPEPVELVGLHGSESLAGGFRHLCALTMDGEVVCLGDNGVGQLGDGTMEDRFEPAAVALP